MQLHGHLNQRSELANLVTEDRLPSSLLLSGPEGVGKRLVARELARQLLCQATGPAPQGGCGKCRPCALFDSGNHPDLHTVEFGLEGVPVEQLREVLDRLSLKAFMGTRKVTILNDADNLSLVGSNVLLKSLEEPRPDSFFIVVVSNPSRLPQTLLSRCQRWFFDRLSSDEIRSILKDRGAAAEEIALASLADGSMLALERLSAKQDALRQVDEAISQAWKGDPATITRIAQTWGSDKEGSRERLAILRGAIRQRLLDNASNTAAAAVWAHALQNALDAEYLILDRHANPSAVYFAVLQSCSQHNATTCQLTPNATRALLEQLGL